MRRALVLIALAAGCIAAGGALIGATMHLPYGHAVYCSLGYAATEGCDATPATGMGRLVAAAVFVVCIPLFAGAGGSLMSAHLRKHMDLHRRATVAQIRHDLDDVKQHTRKTVNGAATALHRRLDDHEDLIRSMAGAAQDADPPLGGERMAPPPAAADQPGGM